MHGLRAAIGRPAMLGPVCMHMWTWWGGCVAAAGRACALMECGVMLQHAAQIERKHCTGTLTGACTLNAQLAHATPCTAA